MSEASFGVAAILTAHVQDGLLIILSINDRRDGLWIFCFWCSSTTMTGCYACIHLLFARLDPPADSDRCSEASDSMSYWKTFPNIPWILYLYTEVRL